MVRDHVAHQITRHAAGPRHVRIPFEACDRIEEGVQPLVHPGPLALVRVHRHREVDVPDLVDHDPDEAHLARERIGARAILVEVGARAVEGNHRIFHAADRAVDRLRGGIGIVEAEARIDLERVDDRGGRIFAPQLAAFLGPEAHGEDGFVLGAGLFHPLRVPDELAARGPGEIAHVGGGEIPGLGPARISAFRGGSFLRGDDEHRLGGVLGCCQTLALRGGEHRVRVLDRPGRGDDVVGGHG